MLSFFKHDRVVANIETLLTVKGCTYDSNLQRRHAYHRLLQEILGYCYATQSRRSPTLEANLTNPDAQNILRRFGSSRLVRHAQIPKGNLAAIYRGVEAGFALLATQGIVDTLQDLIGHIIFARGDAYGGGSAAKLLGIVWINPSPRWTVADYAECLLHEAVHQAQYLDELVRGPYLRSAGSRQSKPPETVSSIRGIKRPFELSFAAACVCIALIEFFERAELAERSVPLCHSLFPALMELEEHSRFLSASGRSVLQEVTKEALAAAAKHALPKNPLN